MPKLPSRGRPARPYAAENRFAALLVADSDDEDAAPAFSLAPSILSAAGGRAVAAAGFAASPGSIFDGAAGAGVAASLQSAAPYAAPVMAPRAAELDLAAVTAELHATAVGRELTAAEAAWDFSGLSSTAADAAQRVAREVADVESRQLVAEARLAALESDKLLLREKLDRGELSHRQRARRGDGIARGEDFVSKLSAKTAKRNAAAKRRNAAKHAY